MGTNSRWSPTFAPADDGWQVCRRLLVWLADAWQQPDESIWEVRGSRQHFVHSKVMAWVAAQRAGE